MQGVILILGVNKMINTTKSLYRYLRRKTGFKGLTVQTVIKNLGFPISEMPHEFKLLSKILLYCSHNGANTNIKGFNEYSSTVKFYFRHRKHIVAQIEKAAEENDEELFSFIQNFYFFHDKQEPSNKEIAKALYARGRKPELDYLYNIFAWYTLEELANTWQRYLEEHPATAEKIAA